ncbi:Beta-1,3-galactosyltransferase galt1 [Dionaea muscipula]
MKKWYGGAVTVSLFMVVLLRYILLKSPIGQSYLTYSFVLNATNPLEWITSIDPADAQVPQNVTQKVISADTLTFSLFAQRNMTKEEKQALLTWNRLKHLISHSQTLPNAVEAIKEAANSWSYLMTSIEEERLHSNDSSPKRSKEKQCPPYLNLNKINATAFDNSYFSLTVPCGLTQDSSITIIGTPGGPLGNFRIDLTGEQIPGEPDQPIILHYNVRLQGDKITDDPVIVQNTWTTAHDWGDEERCPSPEPGTSKKVDDLDRCNEMVGKSNNQTSRTSEHTKDPRRSSPIRDESKNKPYFPFRQGYPFVATLRVGSEGIQMTVDGKHITSFAYRENLEPWFVSQLRISGDVQLISVLVSGLPTSEDLEHVVDLETLKSPPVLPRELVDLFIGVFSTANNFNRRMAVRRTWMQYPEVRSGAVVVRFFVGLHKNQRVNEEMWSEANAYGDIQLMPFVDYYSLITWKTLAICIFGTDVVSAKFVMKTDDDAFVRVDEILASLKRVNVTRGLLYGLINSESQPHRNTDSKWYISPEEWPEDSYPPWAHGPGYVVSHDIARAVSTRQRKGRLKMFKLEDVAMGIWIADMQKKGLQVRYERDERVNIAGCNDGYVVAHYQGPRQLMCLWQKLQDTKQATCCGDR